MTSVIAPWVCCQIGDREHYAVPRALHGAGALELVVTDLWIPPTRASHLLPRRLRDRFHPGLADVSVYAANTASLAFESYADLTGLTGWSRVCRRNEWFQTLTLRALAKASRRDAANKPVLFAYSYAARRLFEFAKRHGWTTVLGQIDPGPVEEAIVGRLHGAQPQAARDWQPAPRQYWENWREECRLADRVIVNSEWSRQALTADGVTACKIRVVPLAYEASTEASRFVRRYPEEFTAARPMRVLFLGQVNLRKGLGAILEAMNAVRDEPIEFWMVGARSVEVADDHLANPRARWIGRVDRAATAPYYRDADVFLFPTHSDGFGLTQLEAQAWKLPLIASVYCGDVVRDGDNGITLSAVTGEAIAAVLRALVADPRRLASFSERAVILPKHSVAGVGDALLAAIA